MDELITSEQREILHKNWHHESNHEPVVKIFSPVGSATWMLTAMNPADDDTMYGLCDLGMGFPELGYVTLSELEGMIIPIMPGAPIGMKLERDLYFEGRYPLTAYADAARQNGSITDDEKALQAALEAQQRETAST